MMKKGYLTNNENAKIIESIIKKHKVAVNRFSRVI